MKTDFLKKLIKEAVREAIQEEIKDILLEAVRSPKTVVQESHTPFIHQPLPQPVSTSNITPDIKRNLRSMIGGEFDTTITATSAMVQPTYTPPPVNTIGDGSSLPPGEVNLNQILNLMNK
jgi:hypothetical protein